MKPDSLEFSAEFAMMVALGYKPPSEVCKDFNVSSDVYDDLLKTPAFNAAVAAHARVLKENGVTLQLKAKILLEQGLGVLADIMSDPDVDAATRIKAVSDIREISGVGGKGTGEAAQPGSSWTLQMVLGNGADLTVGIGEAPRHPAKLTITPSVEIEEPDDERTGSPA